MASKKKLEDLILEVLEEAEYVSGSKLTSMNKEVGKLDFDKPWFGGQIASSPMFMKRLRNVARYCGSVQDEKKFKVDSKKYKLSDKFKRMMAIEMLHKFLNLSIPETDQMGYSPFNSGFGLEKIIVDLFGGQIINGDADDIMFKTPGRESKYSLKFYSEKSIKKYGFGQSFGTLDYWVRKKFHKGRVLNYMVFVKRSIEDKVGFDVYFKTFSYDDIKDKISAAEEAAKAKIKKKTGSEKIDLNFAELTDTEIKEIKETVVLYKGNLKNLKYITSILLPRDIEKFLEISFQEIDEKIKRLYENLDLFKDSLIEYHKAEQTGNERDKAVTAFGALEQSYKKNFFEAKQAEMTFEVKQAEMSLEASAQTQENKSLKKLDKLIERVILEHINK